MKGNKKERTRNYATIVYPESAPDNWIDILSELHIPVFVSPLHDSDISANGEPKKPHYHVQFMFDGVKTKEQVKDIIEQINGVGIEVINCCRSYARYLCHLDDYNKHRYNVGDVVSLGGADYMSVIGTMSDKFRIIRQMLQYINENDITSYSQLVDYANINEPEWFDGLITSCSYFIREYIKSRAWFTYKEER